MRLTVAWLIVSLVVLGGYRAAPAADLKDKVRVEVERIGGPASHEA